MPRIRYWVFGIAVGAVVGVSMLLLNLGALGVAVLAGICYTLATRMLLSKPEIVYDTTRSRRVGTWGGIGAGLVVFLTLGTSALLDSYRSPAPLGIVLFASMGLMWSFGMKHNDVIEAENE